MFVSTQAILRSFFKDLLAKSQKVEQNEHQQVKIEDSIRVEEVTEMVINLRNNKKEDPDKFKLIK